MAETVTTQLPVVGKTCTAVTIGRPRLDPLNDSIKFAFDDGTSMVLRHEQDCCETVTIESISGDFAHLYGVPLLVAEKRESTKRDEGWTFYCFRTVNGTVDIRWHGESEYYSIAVDHILYDKDGKEVNRG